MISKRFFCYKSKISSGQFSNQTFSSKNPFLFFPDFANWYDTKEDQRQIKHLANTFWITPTSNYSNPNILYPNILPNPLLRSNNLSYKSLGMLIPIEHNNIAC